MQELQEDASGQLTRSLKVAQLIRILISCLQNGMKKRTRNTRPKVDRIRSFINAEQKLFCEQLYPIFRAVATSSAEKGRRQRPGVMNDPPPAFPALAEIGTLRRCPENGRRGD